MKNITIQIEKYIDSITAVIILANGTVPRITVGTDDALSFLSTISPKIPVKHMCSILTNVPSSLSQNFPGDAFPDILTQFVLDNPVALQKKYLKLKDDPNMKKVSMDLRTMVKVGEQKALEMLVDLFDQGGEVKEWGLEAQIQWSILTGLKAPGSWPACRTGS